MHLIKDSSIIVTKTTHTAEEFIRKKIELLVNRKIEGYINAFFLSLSFSLFNRKMKLNHSMLLISKIFATNIFVGLHRCLVSHHITVRLIDFHSINRKRSRVFFFFRFLAVKCNDDINIIKLLAYLGAGFDCASKV